MDQLNPVVVNETEIPASADGSFPAIVHPRKHLFHDSRVPETLSGHDIETSHSGLKGEVQSLRGTEQAHAHVPDPDSLTREETSGRKGLNLGVETAHLFISLGRRRP